MLITGAETTGVDVPVDVAEDAVPPVEVLPQLAMPNPHTRASARIRIVEKGIAPLPASMEKDFRMPGGEDIRRYVIPRTCQIPLEPSIRDSRYLVAYLPVQLVCRFTKLGDTKSR